MRLQTRDRNINRLTFSPDGRTLVVTGSASILLWELGSGETRRIITKRLWRPSSVAYSHDGHKIAIGINSKRKQLKGDFFPSNQDEIQIYDLATNQIVSTLIGHDGVVGALSFSPDDRILASGSEDTTALLWDVAALKKTNASVPLTALERAACWADLASDAEKAFTTLWKFVADKETVNLLQENLKPAAALSPEAEKDIHALIADLGSEQFAVRSQATKQLAKFGIDIEEELRKSLVDGLTLETRRRVEELLASITTQQLRTVRAIEVLEYINSQDARNLLEALAKGRADARQTREAKEVAGTPGESGREVKKTTQGERRAWVARSEVIRRACSPVQGR